MVKEASFVIVMSPRWNPMLHMRTLLRALPLFAPVMLTPLAAAAQTTPAPAPAAFTCPAPAAPNVLSACQQGAQLVSDGAMLVVAPAGGAVDIVVNVPWAGSAGDIAIRNR